MPAARTFSPPITAKAATRSDALKMIALTRLDMMMRISFVLDVAGPLLAYLHYISTFGCAPLVAGCKSAALQETVIPSEARGSPPWRTDRVRVEGPRGSFMAHAVSKHFHDSNSFGASRLN